MLKRKMLRFKRIILGFPKLAVHICLDLTESGHCLCFPLWQRYDTVLSFPALFNFRPRGPARPEQGRENTRREEAGRRGAAARVLWVLWESWPTPAEPRSFPPPRASALVCTQFLPRCPVCRHCLPSPRALHPSVTRLPRALGGMELGSGSKIQASCLGLIMTILMLIVSSNHAIN